MKVKDLIKELKKFNPEAEFLVSCDEELNTLFTRWEVAELGESEEDGQNNEVVIYGFSGSEKEEVYIDERSVEELLAEELSKVKK